MKKTIENTLNRAIGTLGGIVVAAVCSLLTFYTCAQANFHIIWLISISIGFFLIIPLMALFYPNHFVAFIIPILNGLGNAEGMEHDDDGFEWAQFLTMIAYVLTLIALSFSALFQMHLIVAVSTISFIAYAFASPRIYKLNESNKAG